MNTSCFSSLRRTRLRLAAALLTLGWLAGPGRTEASTNQWPDLPTVYGALQKQLPSLPAPSAGETNTAAYVQSLAPWVVLSADVAGTSTSTGLVTKAQIYPGAVAYLRISRVESGLASALETALQPLRASGQPPLSGVVLDLRFAGGEDYAAAAEAAARFAATNRPGYRWGDQALDVQPSSPPNALPVMVLAHRRTRGAAEALAAMVRQTAPASLVIGTNTAGEARRYTPLEVAGAPALRIAGTPLTLPEGKEFPVAGWSADLAVDVPEAEERQYFEDEYRRLVRGKSVTPGPVSFRVNEAELVRRRRTDRGSGSPHGGPSSGRPSIPAGGSAATTASASLAVQDPALARALDLLTALGEANASEASRDSR